MLLSLAYSRLCYHVVLLHSFFRVVVPVVVLVFAIVVVVRHSSFVVRRSSSSARHRHPCCYHGVLLFRVVSCCFALLLLLFLSVWLLYSYRLIFCGVHSPLRGSKSCAHHAPPELWEFVFQASHACSTMPT